MSKTNFIHDITKIYFTFNLVGNWFYVDPGYSKEFVERSGYKFDGQFFFRQRSKQ